MKSIFVIFLLTIIQCGLAQYTGQSCEDRYRGQGDSLRQLKCAALCRAEASNIIQNGEFTSTGLFIRDMPEEQLRQKSPAEQAQFRAMKGCLNIQDSDACELAYRFFTCVANNNAK